MKLLKKPIIIVVAVMLMLLTSVQASPIIGDYSSSVATKAISLDKNVTFQKEEVALLAVAGGVVLAVAFAIGVIDGWNSVSSQTLAYYNFEQSNYNSYDFSKFDN